MQFEVDRVIRSLPCDEILISKFAKNVFYTTKFPKNAEKLRPQVVLTQKKVITGVAIYQHHFMIVLPLHGGWFEERFSPPTLYIKTKDVMEHERRVRKVSAGWMEWWISTRKWYKHWEHNSGQREMWSQCRMKLVKTKDKIGQSGTVYIDRAMRGTRKSST